MNCAHVRAQIPLVVSDKLAENTRMLQVVVVLLVRPHISKILKHFLADVTLVEGLPVVGVVVVVVVVVRVPVVGGVEGVAVTSVQQLQL